MKAILKKLTFPVAGLFCLGFVACDDDLREINYNIRSGDELYSPASGFEVDLGTRANTTFEWAPSIAEDGGYVAYNVLFDKSDGDFSNPIASVPSQLTGSQSHLTMTAKDLNKIARASGLDKVETGTLKWTVKASKGLFGEVYSEANTITVTTMNAMNPLPTAVALEGNATEDPADGIQMALSAGIDGIKAEEGAFECFARFTAATFTIADDQGRYYGLNANGTITDSETPIDNTISGGAGIYWLKLEFDGMIWSAQKVSKVELQASSTGAWAGNWWSDLDWKVVFAMTYDGKGVWVLKDYDNRMSVDKSGAGVDDRHKFKMTVGDGSVYYLCNNGRSLGASYTTDYMKVDIFTSANVGNADWDRSWNFLTADKGRPFDGYLYMNGDNPAGTWWHEYKFK